MAETRRYESGGFIMLGLNQLFECATEFADLQSDANHKSLLGVTDGKAVGTYIEHLFIKHLQDRYPNVEVGNSAKGIDLPDPKLNCDIKATSAKQPQSSCPYRSTDQKIYGLGYNLLLFVYRKKDIDDSHCSLEFLHVALIEKERTGDYTLTKRLQEMLSDGGNVEDIVAYFEDKALPGDEITLRALAERVFNSPPTQGYLTISNALQWRLQYSHAIGLENQVAGVLNYDR